MLDVMIVDGAVIEHNSLGAALMSANRIAETLSRADLQRLRRNMEARSPFAPIMHWIDRGARIIADWRN